MLQESQKIKVMVSWHVTPGSLVDKYRFWGSLSRDHSPSIPVPDLLFSPHGRHLWSEGGEVTFFQNTGNKQYGVTILLIRGMNFCCLERISEFAIVCTE
jgi:hypothetical protein